MVSKHPAFLCSQRSWPNATKFTGTDYTPPSKSLKLFHRLYVTDFANVTEARYSAFILTGNPSVLATDFLWEPFVILQLMGVKLDNDNIINPSKFLIKVGGVEISVKGERSIDGVYGWTVGNLHKGSVVPVSLWNFIPDSLVIAAWCLESAALSRVHERMSCRCPVIVTRFLAVLSLIMAPQK